MDYREKLNASQEKAHLQNIATKIDREMRDLRSQAETSPTVRRRWVWELIQNARDVHHNDGVSIQIEFDESSKKLMFRHSGQPFTADNIRFLIEQISTKDRGRDSTGVRKTTGKFGTGFLSTHLLSELVIVTGIAKEPELEFKQFSFELDRSGYDLPSIASSVERAKQSVQNLDELPVYSQYDPTALNTVFTYAIADSVAQRVAREGIDDLHKCLLCAFANSEGGYLVLGVNESGAGDRVSGLSKDFHANAVTQRAISLLSPPPVASHQYVEYEGKTLFVIKVDKSASPIATEGIIYRRVGDRVVHVEPVKRDFKRNNYSRLEQLSARLDQHKQVATGAKVTFANHIQSVLKIVDDLPSLLYPASPTVATTSQEGKILARILFSSCADTFESYLSDLLYEIYLANPNTLKSGEQVTITDVLNCADIQEFIDVWARRKLGKLQRGSVKGFIADNKQIDCLNVFDDAQQDEIEKVLQIRHLYSHRNGIVDEKFLKYFPGQFTLNEVHSMPLDTLVDKFEYLSDTVQRIDIAAVGKYNLVTIT